MEGFALSEEQLSELKVAHRKAKHSNAHAAYKTEQPSSIRRGVHEGSI